MTDAQTPQTQMYLVYIDESYDGTHYAYSAVFVPAFEWNRVFMDIVNWRRTLFTQHNIPLDYELHGTKFVGGQGEPENNRDKNFRARLFNQAFDVFESIAGISVINAITGNKQNYMTLFEYMLNRINRTLQARNAYGVLVCDEGNEGRMISIVRKMKKDNEIASDDYHRYHGNNSRNIPLERIIEDPLFKTSKSSYFIQLADFIAFSLLRNEKPMEGTKEPVKTAFEKLDKILVKEAFKKDKRGKGIVRV